MEPGRTRRHRHRFLAIPGAALLVLSPWLGCGGAKSECRAETWEGTCKLLGVTKIKESELPLPNVVLEALYRPESAPGAPPPNFPDVRREFGALSKHQDALRQHLESQTAVRCYLNPPSPGACQPGPVVVEVAEFDATRASANVDTGPKGCAQIESASSQDRLTQADSQGVEVIPERLQFAESSVELPPDAPALVDTVAARLKEHPNLECVGIVGQYVRGENMEVAFGRARAVRELLVARGVEPERLVVLTVGAQLMATGANPEPPDPTDRRVAFSVLLDVKPKE